MIQKSLKSILHSDGMHSRTSDCLPDLFESRAIQFPQRTAVEFGSVRLTYRELNEASNRLSRYLRLLGARPESSIAMWLPRSAETYVALLGILKAGAAYVPIDAEYPADRVDYILENSGSKVLITTREYSDRLLGFEGMVVLIDQDWPAIASGAATSLSRSERGCRPENLCYIIYTSGSTGKPKGVQIEHRNAVHLVKTEAARFAIRPDDRIYQGFSIAFDASVEELWLAWFAGATLVGASSDVVHSGPDLPRFLTERNITVLSCVPTLLAMMEGDLPTVRLLIVGGEVCPADLVTRWCSPDRKMFNTYGPTEATVIATWTECDPVKSVTIGEPLPGYSAFVMDEAAVALPPGQIGELYLGGKGLARGYLGRDDLTRERFVVTQTRGSDQQRLYRTGDLARWTEDGQLEFLGRADGQVKLRGFRIELSEIEAEMLRCRSVQAVAVTVREDVPSIQQLVAYVIGRDGCEINESEIRRSLLETLPNYMVPTVFESVDSFPTLTSGKVDRKSLPVPRARSTDVATSSREKWHPETPLEKQLLEAWSEVFSHAAIGPNDNFFTDLGGHSLLAARMVSALRQSSDVPDISMLDVYNHPTISRLADALRRRKSAVTHPANPSSASPEATQYRDAPRRHWWCSIAQSIGLYFIVGFFSLQWLAPYLTYTFLLDDEYSGLEAAVLSLLTLVLLYPAMLMFSIATKWVVLGRIKPGRYRLWGPYFLRWWFAQAIRNIVPTGYLTGTPLLAWYYRLMGARVGANVYLGNDGVQAFDLLSIGDDSSLGADSHFTCATVEDGWLVLGPITIGSRCHVGTRAVLRPDSRIDDDGELGDLSLLRSGATIPKGECWIGSPSRRIDQSTDVRNEVSNPRPSLLRRFIYGLLFVVGVMVFPLLPMAAFFPGMVFMAQMNYIDEYYSYLVLSPIVATSFVVLISLEIVVVKWLLLGRIRPGTYPLYQSFYFRKWFVDRLLTLSLDVIGPLYSTLYLAPWYRLLGAKIGYRTEISTASFVSPDCLDIDDESFVADAVSLGAARVRNGSMTIDTVRIGKRSFIGNSALVPIGTRIPENCLIGCLSLTPTDRIPAGSSHLGSPSFVLPQRHVSTEFTEEETFRPSKWLVAQRLFIEFFRITLPSTIFIIFTNVLLSAILLMRDEIPIWQIVLIFPVLYFLAGCAGALVVIGFKWVLMGVYQAGEHPLWSHFVWRTELVTSLLDNFASPFFLDLLAGTPLICWFFRLMGATIGRRVYLDTTELTEFDLVRVGNDVAVNLDCTLQTHLFEDRVMKMSTIQIGERSSLGSMSLILYDTKIGNGVNVGDLSLVMKGELLPALTSWTGIPGCRD